MEALAKRISSVFDLGADSLDTVELVMELGSEYDIWISEDDVERLATVEDAIAFLQAHVNRD